MSGVKAFAIGGTSYYAVKTDGTLWAWGVNRSKSQSYVDGVPVDEWSAPLLGAGSKQELILTPVKVMEGVQSVETGGHQSYAIKADGTLWAWGQNLSGDLGDGTKTHRSAPVKIMDNVRAFSSSGAIGLAVKKDGSVWAWGSNEAGKFQVVGGSKRPPAENTLATGIIQPTVQSPRQVQGITLK